MLDLIPEIEIVSKRLDWLYYLHSVKNVNLRLRNIFYQQPIP